MVRIRKLKGIANGLLGTFVSRNSNIGGYWALGVLRELAVLNALETITIDLLDDGNGPLSPTKIRSVEEHYYQWLDSVLKKDGVDPNVLLRAEIKLRFGTFEDFPEAIRDTWGDPYYCTVSLITKTGRLFQTSKLGVCAIHDPARESRRADCDIFRI